MPNKFLSPDGDLESTYVTDYEMIDQYAKAGSLWTAGYGAFGQMGDGTTVNRSSPVQIAGTGWAKTVSGWTMVAAIKDDGTLYTWGQNAYGALGVGSSNSIEAYPVQVPGTWKDVAISSESTSMLGIKSDGTLWAWGYNNYGQLGIGSADTNNHNTPIQIGSDTWKYVAIGSQSCMAIKSDGTLWGWGRNNYSVLGLGDTTPRYSPTQVGTDSDWKQIACGLRDTWGIKTSGALWVWGSYSFFSTPYLYGFSPSPINSNWKSISAEQYTFGGIKTNGTLWMWGQNSQGELGQGNAGTVYGSIVQVPGTNWKQFACGSHAIKSDGTLWGWGANTVGNAGVGVDNGVISTPTQIGTETNWKWVSKNPLAAIKFYSV